jgi:hypothetical protein
MLYDMYDDKACRTGSGGSGTNGDEYQKYQGGTFSQCMAECDGRTDCKGFEYSTNGDTHCEIWFDEPLNFASKDGSKCYVKRQENQDDNVGTGGDNGSNNETGGISSNVQYQTFPGMACRTKSGGSGGRDDEYERTEDENITYSDCKEECDKRQDCKGFEFKVTPRHCEIWLETPGSFLQKEYYTCNVKIST